MVEEKGKPRSLRTPEFCARSEAAMMASRDMPGVPVLVFPW